MHNCTGLQFSNFPSVSRHDWEQDWKVLLLWSGQKVCWNFFVCTEASCANTREKTQGSLSLIFIFKLNYVKIRIFRACDWPSSRVGGWNVMRKKNKLINQTSRHSLKDYLIVYPSFSSWRDDSFQRHWDRCSL